MFEGNYTQLRRSVQQAPSAAPDAERTSPRREIEPEAPRRGARRVRSRAGASPGRDAQDRLKRVEERIAQLERRLEELAQRIGEVAARGNYLESRRVGEEYGALERELRALYDEWAGHEERT